jgi:hypothetical protein
LRNGSKILGKTSLSLVAQTLLSVPFNQVREVAQTRVSALPLKKLYPFISEPFLTWVLDAWVECVFSINAAA